MRFSRTRFNKHLANIGQQVTWCPAFVCACIDANSGSPDPRCKLCLKRGWIYGDVKQTVCGVARQETQAQWAASGLWEEGDVVVTVPENSPMWDGGQYDRVVLLNATEKFSLPLVRGSHNDNLKLYAVTSIDRVFWRHPQTQMPVDGGVPAVGADGELTWADREPPMGVQYSITGHRNVEYYIFGNFPANRNMHSGMRLPKRVVLRRWDMSSRLA